MDNGAGRVALEHDPDGEGAALDPEILFADLRGARGLLLAVSGGPDSTALLLLIDRWRRESGMPVGVATVDHRLRPESEDEAGAVAELCRMRRFPHHTLVWEGTAVRTRLQERARKARYDLLSSHARDIGADTIVTGHHADDQAETILMRLLRGSGPAGLAGMARLTRRGSVQIARPLLGVRKAQLAGLCRAEGVAFAQDPSNDDIAFRRPALRQLAPLLAAEGLHADALRRLGQRAAHAEGALRWAECVARDRLAIERDGCGTRIRAQSFTSLPSELVLRIVRGELTHHAPDSPLRLERLEPLVERLLTAIAEERAYAATLAGCTVRLRAGTVTIARAPARGGVATHYPSSAALLGKEEIDA